MNFKTLSKQERREAQGKDWARSQFNKLLRSLDSHLGKNDENRKRKIIRQIEARRTNQGKNSKKEVIFRNYFVNEVLTKFFQKSKYKNIKAEVEGVSRGSTKAQEKIFGASPLADFIFVAEGQTLQTLFPSRLAPFPMNTVGEVKYDVLTFRNFVTGLGQIMGRLGMDYDMKYGFYLFFNTDLQRSVTKKEEEFIKLLWDKENIYVVVI